MYTVEQGMELLYADPTFFVVAAVITYGFGFVQYLTSVWMQVKNNTCPFYFWQHCWYFGHDMTFAFVCFGQWFFVVKFWMFDVMCIACMLFVLIELYTFYRAIKYERQEIFGRFTGGREVTVKYALTRGIVGYLIGFVLFVALRQVIGDPFCLFLMMSTNATLALMVQRRNDEYGVTMRGAKFLAWATLLGTCFTFAPAGIGLFATMVPPLQSWVFTAFGLVCIATSVRAVWQCHTRPKHPELQAIIDAKKAGRAA